MNIGRGQQRAQGEAAHATNGLSARYTDTEYEKARKSGKIIRSPTIQTHEAILYKGFWGRAWLEQ